MEGRVGRVAPGSVRTTLPASDRTAVKPGAPAEQNSCIEARS